MIIVGNYFQKTYINMEKLPRVLKKREADKTRGILEMINFPCVLEIKQTKTDTLYANSVKPHQLANLLKAQCGIFRYKIPDLGQRNPFDAVILKEIPAYIVILYGNGQLVMINAEKFPPIDQKLKLQDALKIGLAMN